MCEYTLWTIIATGNSGIVNIVLFAELIITMTDSHLSLKVIAACPTFRLSQAVSTVQNCAA